MPAPALTCPRCQSTVVVKNGRIHNGRQNFKCKGCGRQFVQNPTKKIIGQETKELIDAFVVGEIVIGSNHQNNWSKAAMVADIRQC